MSSSDNPHQTPADSAVGTEAEPLLGRPGDAIQKPNMAMITNLLLGTGWVAELGGVLLLAVVWAAIFTTKPIAPLFAPHPLLQSLGVFILLQAILILQPTSTPQTKIFGARAHATLNLFSFLLFASGIAMIEVNKVAHNMQHFYSPHGILGLVTSILMLVQYIFGFLMWAVPAVFGGVDKAKALWKYHRWIGYTIFLLVLATVLSATSTTYNRKALHIKLWSLSIASALIVAGVFPRIQIAKLGIRRASA